jgi:hypothetical protein
MLIQRASASLCLAAFLVCSAAIPGVAQTAASSPAAMAAPTHPPVPKASSLIKVSACNPALNVAQSGGFVGYAPGWGYRGGYYGDPWGARYYQPPVTTANPQLGIDYTNISHKPMTEIQFGLVANGVVKAEVRDVGTFSPGAEIKHKFGISANTFPIGTGLPQCVPFHITFADGTKWRNPALPPKNTHIYYHP